jgi:hypothetical protein
MYAPGSLMVALPYPFLTFWKRVGMVASLMFPLPSQVIILGTFALISDMSCRILSPFGWGG